MEKENSNFGAMVKGFLMMTVIIGFICGFIFSNELVRLVNKIGNKSIESESTEVVVAGPKSNKTLGFNEKYVESDSDNTYDVNLGTYAGSTGLYFTLEYGNTNKELKVTKYNYDNEDAQEHTLTFVSNVVDVFSGQFYDDPSNNMVFYLLENGDVCYSIIEEMVKTDSYGSYITIDNLQGVVKFYNGNSCNEETGACSSTVFAQTRDSKIYDLAEYVFLK